MVRETALTVDDLIWPIFIMAGENRREPVGSMPGVYRMTIDLAVEEAAKAASLGIPAIALFPYTDPGAARRRGSEALNPQNLVCSGLPRHQGPGAEHRDHHRCRARSLYLARP
jgi:porphobilinogen synthase